MLKIMRKVLNLHEYQKTWGKWERHLVMSPNPLFFAKAVLVPNAGAVTKELSREEKVFWYLPLYTATLPS